MNQGQIRGFDLKTHPRHPKTGQVVAENHYSLVVKQSDKGSGAEWLYERPPGSGLYYYPNGQLAPLASAEGLARQELEEKERSKSAVERAKSQYEVAKAAVEAAELAHANELKVRATVESKSLNYLNASLPTSKGK